MKQKRLRYKLLALFLFLLLPSTIHFWQDTPHFDEKFI